jgi:hypothetical protein
MGHWAYAKERFSRQLTTRNTFWGGFGVVTVAAVISAVQGSLWFLLWVVLLLGALAFFYYLGPRTFWQEIVLSCPQCQARVSSGEHWVCSSCHGLNASGTQSRYSFLNCCHQCKAEPKAYRCHNCGEMVTIGNYREGEVFAFNAEEDRARIEAYRKRQAQEEARRSKVLGVDPL